MNAFSSIRDTLHLKFHPLVLNLFWNPPLLLFVFQTSLMMLQSIQLTHSCLFMGGGTGLLALNSLLFTLSHLCCPSCSTLHQCLHPHPPALHPLIQILLLHLFPLLHLPLLALSAIDALKKSGSQSNGQSHSTTGSIGIHLQQFHLLMKMTLMIPWTC